MVDTWLECLLVGTVVYVSDEHGVTLPSVVVDVGAGALLP